MKEIPLTRGLVALVDDADYEWLSQFKWHAASTGYAARTISDATKKSRYRSIYMHRLILNIVDEPKTLCDHADGSRLNNQRNNLRSCSASQNSCNRGAQRNSRSGFKCVTKGSSGRWYAYIQDSGKKKNLGSFSSPEEAFSAYCEAARKIHGEFFRPA